MKDDQVIKEKIEKKYLKKEKRMRNQIECLIRRVGEFLIRGRHVRNPGTHGFRGSGWNPPLFQKYGFRWVPGSRFQVFFCADPCSELW